MERWNWIAVLAEPTFLVLVAVEAGISLLLVPAPPGLLIAGAVAIGLFSLNCRLDQSVNNLPVRAGPEAILGQVAVVSEPLAPVGVVRCGGEMWKAVEVNGRGLDAGEQVTVVGIRGLELRVVWRE